MRVFVGRIRQFLSAGLRYKLLLFVLTAQALTIVGTWPLWQIRESPPNLPVSEALPSIPVGVALLGTLLFAVVRPAWGVVCHAAVLGVACVLDQYRLSPQFWGLLVLMIGCLNEPGTRFCRWYLAAMWFWAGAHKLLSPDWLGHTTASLLRHAGIETEGLELPIAASIGVAELLLGLLACVRPRWAAFACVPLHLGIALFMSPLLADRNYSVIPWNIATAIVGYWVMRQVGLPPDAAAIAEITLGRRRWFASRRKLLEGAVVATLWLLPVGFYFGWVDRCFCHVLYSDNLPRGLITGRDGVSGIKGWGSLGVPFPRERRLIRLYFEKTAEAGDKLHLYEPRPYLSDAFYILEQQRSLPISLERFYDLKPGEVAGVGLDSPRSIFALSRANAKLLRESPRSMIYAVAISPRDFDRQMLSQLARLPNLQQIQLSGTDVRDDDLKAFRSLRLLTGLGLNHTRVTNRGLTYLQHLPYLNYVEAEGTTITAYRN